MPSPTDRFSDRVENYVRYRPSYPAAVLDVLREEIGLTPDWSIADVGSGTGISAALLLDNGNEVFAVEPNGPMRAAAEKLLAPYPKFHAVDGTAEATTLDARSVDAVVAAQAFHWFDPAAFGGECRRILKPNGWAVLLWNARRLDATPFLRGYEELLQKYGTDYARERRRIAARLLFWDQRAEEKRRELSTPHAGWTSRSLAIVVLRSRGWRSLTSGDAQRTRRPLRARANQRAGGHRVRHGNLLRTDRLISARGTARNQLLLCLVRSARLQSLGA